MSLDQLKSKISEGRALLMDKEVLNLQTNWELVVLVQGCCLGLPQRIELSAPKIVSNRFIALQLLESYEVSEPSTARKRTRCLGGLKIGFCGYHVRTNFFFAILTTVLHLHQGRIPVIHLELIRTIMRDICTGL